jgi:U3 small nucleolar RNA-associated protein 12
MRSSIFRLKVLRRRQSEVTILRFNSSGTLLVSGSKDTDIVLWDIVQETGIARLKGTDRLRRS